MEIAIGVLNKFQNWFASCNGNGRAMQYSIVLDHVITSADCDLSYNGSRLYRRFTPHVNKVYGKPHLKLGVADVWII